MTTQFTRISNAGPDAVLSCGFGAPTVITARSYRQLGLTIPFYFTHGVGSQQFIDGARGAAEGIRVPVSALLVADQLSEDDPQREVVQAYAREYENAYGERPAAFGGFAYDALFLVLEAAKRAGTMNKATVRDEIERTSGFVGIDGIFNMSPEDHMGLSGSDLAFRMTEVRDDGWLLIE